MYIEMILKIKNWK